MRVVYSSIRDTCKATREIEAPPTLLSDYRHGADAHCGPRKAGLAERQKSSPALFAQEQVSVTHLPRKSCPRYGKEKVNAAVPTVSLPCALPDRFLEGDCGGCRLHHRSRGRSGTVCDACGHDALIPASALQQGLRLRRLH
jgi:hypothetical protein